MRVDNMLHDKFKQVKILHEVIRNGIMDYLIGEDEQH